MSTFINDSIVSLAACICLVNNLIIWITPEGKKLYQNIRLVSEVLNLIYSFVFIWIWQFCLFYTYKNFKLELIFNILFLSLWINLNWLLCIHFNKLLKWKHFLHLFYCLIIKKIIKKYFYTFPNIFNFWLVNERKYRNINVYKVYNIFMI